jgi:hypothetical protein
MNSVANLTYAPSRSSSIAKAGMSLPGDATERQRDTRRLGPKKSAAMRLRLAAPLLCLLASVWTFEAAHADTPICEVIKHHRDRLIERMRDTPYGFFHAVDEISAAVDILIEGLNKTKEDVDGGLEKVEDAKDKLDKVAEFLGDKNQLSGYLKKAVEAIDGFAERVGNANEYVGKAVEKLEKLKEILSFAKLLEKLIYSSGAEQIRAMNEVLKQFKENFAEDTPIGPVLEIYVRMVDVIAGDAEKYEREVKAKIRQLVVDFPESSTDEFEKGRYDKIYFVELEPPIDVARRQFAQLMERKNQLEKRLAEHLCIGWAPKEKIDRCLDPKQLPGPARESIDEATKDLRSAYDAAQARYEDGVLRLASLDQGPSPERASLADHENAIDRLQRAVGTGSLQYLPDKDRSDPLAVARSVAQALNVSLPTPPSRDWQISARQYLPILKKALADKDRALAAADARALEERHAALLANAKRARTERDDAKIALDKAIGEASLKLAADKNWTAAQTAEFDDCYPSYGALREAAKARQRPNPEAPIESDPKPKQECKNPGGLIGPLIKEACDIGK